MSHWGKSTRACVAHGVGQSFGVHAGLTGRARAWYQDHHLEWLYRARRQESVRLGRRYLTTNMSFMAVVTRESMRRPRGGRS